MLNECRLKTRPRLLIFSFSFLILHFTLPSYAASPTANAPTIAPGWDWSLPEGLKPVPYSGFVTWGAKIADPSITVNGVHISWKSLNPAPGQYDWKPLLDAIEKNRAAGIRTGIHLMGVEHKLVPDWIIEKYKPPVVDVPVLQENQPWRLKTVPPWIPEVDRAFHDFLAAFGKTGIPQREEVVYGYIHGISPSRGEELSLRPQDVAIYEKVSGLTPQVFGDWLRRRTDAMLLAFKGVEYKLAWMSGNAVGPTQAYKDANKDLWKYALDHGTGIRGGGIDFQHGLFNAPAWGCGISADGYALVDDENPTIAQHRFRGDENEEYGKGWEWRFGPVEGHPYRSRICWLRCLQVRQNFQMVSKATLEQNPDMNQFVLLSQGRTRDNSPDAWAYLRECKLGKNKPQPVKNIERWLVQREVEGSRSVAAEKVERFKLSQDPQGVNYDFDARRTDRGTGQDGLAFQFDKVFWPKPAPAIVKVTYTDRAAAHWRLVTSNSAGKTIQSDPVANTGDNQLKTATFQVAGLSATGAFPGKMDFRLVTEGPGDLTCSMVRVIKADWKNPDNK